MPACAGCRYAAKGATALCRDCSVPQRLRLPRAVVSALVAFPAPDGVAHAHGRPGTFPQTYVVALRQAGLSTRAPGSDAIRLTPAGAEAWLRVREALGQDGAT